MPHPKARTNRRPRKRRSTEPRLVITAKGYALLHVLDQLRGVFRMRSALERAQLHENGRATPCAPKRGNHAPAPLPANDAGTAGAPHAHPAGKSGAADRANDKEPTP